MRTMFLTNVEIKILDRPIGGNGGFQSLLRRWSRRIDRTTGRLDLSDCELEQIPRYAFDYGNNGWEDRLKAIFSRTLGIYLGRSSALEHGSA